MARPRFESKHPHTPEFMLLATTLLYQIREVQSRPKKTPDVQPLQMTVISLKAWAILFSLLCSQGLTLGQAYRRSSVNVG